MRASYWLIGAAAVLAMTSAAACKVTVEDSSGGSGSTSSSTSKASSSSTKASSSVSTGGMTTGSSSSTGGGVGPFADPVCAAPASPPSMGACYTPQAMGCNPITGTPCDGAAGEACDFSQNTEFECYPAPGNDGTLCGTCDPENGIYCANGLECLQTDLGTDMPTEFKCFKFCCTDADCGGAAGSCNLDILGEAYGLCATVTM